MSKRTHLAKVLFFIAMFPFFVSCLKTNKASTVAVGGKEDKVSKAAAERLFKRLVGRSPRPSELRDAVGKMTFDEYVDILLGSDLYASDIFYHLHEERLLLTPEGGRNFMTNARSQYCGMRFDMSSYANEKNYWSVLSDRRHWVELPISGCFAGMTLADVGELAAKLENNDFASLTAREQVCQNDLMTGGISQGQGLEEFKKKIDESPSSERVKPFITSKLGREFISDFLMQRFFPELSWMTQEMKNQLKEDNGWPDSFVDFKLQMIPFARKLVNQAGSLTDCKYESLDPVSLSQLKEMEDGTDAAYFQVFFPNFAAGIHGSQYFLNRHPSKPTNRNLHRGRLLYFSHFCQDLPADAANNSGTPAEIIPELDEFFAEDDTHAKSDSNCYGCHTTLQPISNYFSRLGWGVNYNDANFFDVSFTGMSFDINSVFPAGIWNGQEFVNEEKHWTLADFAKVVSSSEKAKSCLVRSVWNKLASDQMEMNQAETENVLASLETGNFRKVLSDMLTKQMRMRNYYVTGSLQVKTLEDNYECPDAVSEDFTDEEMKMFAGACASCHTKGFLPLFKDKVFYLDETLADQARFAATKDVYCSIIKEEMPPSPKASFGPENQRTVACKLRTAMKKLAESSESISTEQYNQPCGMDVLSTESN